MELNNRLWISLEALLLGAHTDLPDRVADEDADADADDAEGIGATCVVKPETAAGTTVRRTTDAASSAASPGCCALRRRRNLLLIIVRSWPLLVSVVQRPLVSLRKVEE